jgi:hypothetical protein
MSSHDRPAHPAPSPKRAYRPPVIHVYGNIRAITQTVGNSGGLDGGPTGKPMKSLP